MNDACRVDVYSSLITSSLTTSSLILAPCVMMHFGRKYHASENILCPQHLDLLITTTPRHYTWMRFGYNVLIQILTKQSHSQAFFGKYHSLCNLAVLPTVSVPISMGTISDISHNNKYTRLDRGKSSQQQTRSH